MESLERDLEIYNRERDKARDMAKSYTDLIKATREKIKVRDEEAAAIAAVAEAEAAAFADPE